MVGDVAKVHVTGRCGSREVIRTTTGGLALPLQRFFFLIALLPALIAASPAGPITLGQQLGEWADLESLTYFPSPRYQTRLVSSHDPASTSPLQRDTWFANRDWGHYRGTIFNGDRREYILADLKGPGVLARLWTANPGGNLYVYADGATTPILAGVSRDILRGRVEPITWPFAHNPSRASTFYFPIPFRQSLRITTDEPIGEGLMRYEWYFQATYRQYEEGTDVQTPASLGGEDVRKALYSARERWLARPRGPDSTTTETLVLNAANGWKAVLDRKSPTAIYALRLSPSGFDAAALRGSLLRMSFDGTETIAVPLGDFFASSPGTNEMRTLPMRVSPSGLRECYLPMPFKGRVEIAIDTFDRKDAVIICQVAMAPYEWNERSLYLHAAWSPGERQRTDPEERTMIAIRGRGVYIGTHYSVASLSPMWWGEGDERLYVDDESVASWAGTGTEDYFGYAWSSADIFNHPFHAQSRADGPLNYGRVSLVRWHLPDPIPFQNSFRFDQELLTLIFHPDHGTTIDSVHYWYGDLQTTHNLPRPRRESLRIPPIPPYSPMRISLADGVEGESMAVVVPEDGKVEPVDVVDLAGRALNIAAVSGDAALRWQTADPRGRLILQFPAPKAGRYRVVAWIVRDLYTGRARFAINGQPSEAVFEDYFYPYLPSEVDLGVFDLGEQNRIEIQLDGAAVPYVLPNHVFLLDALRLLPPDQPAQSMLGLTIIK